MSKTVKTVMTVMMIGLVAMLGANAEAHYYPMSGRAKYCSVGVDVDLRKDDEGVNSFHHTEEVEVVATIPPGGAEILCLDGTIKKSMVEVILRVQEPIDVGDITTQVDDQGVPILTTAELEVIIADTVFLVNNNCVQPGVPVPQRDVLIRKTSVKIKTYACEDNTATTNCSLVDGAFPATTYTLSDRFNLKLYPNNLPPIGTLYNSK